jgi:type IV secretory pathway VirB10-like protein
MATRKKSPPAKKAPARRATPANPPRVTTKPQKAAAREKVEPETGKLATFGIAQVCKLLAGGEMLTAVAEKAKVTKSSLSEWLAADAERSARAREARKLGAAFLEEQAQAAIQNAKNAFELAKARELAQHLRWKASKLNSRDFGDKLAVGGAEDLPPVQTDNTHVELPMALRASRVAALLAKAQGLRDAQGKGT